MTSKIQLTPGLNTPPPVLYLAALFAGYGFHYLFPLSLNIDNWGQPIGALLIILSIPIMPPVLKRFKKMKTSFDVRKGAKVLITDGPFRLSRNPTYVSLTLLYLGLGLVFNNIWILIFVIPVLIIMNQWVIRREELHLEAVFGEEFLRYKAKVRRWL